MLAFQATRSPAQEVEARKDADMPAPDWARRRYRADFTPERFPLALRLFDEVRPNMTRVIDAIAGHRTGVRPHLPQPDQMIRWCLGGF